MTLDSLTIGRFDVFFSPGGEGRTMVEVREDGQVIFMASRDSREQAAIEAGITIASRTSARRRFALQP